MATHRKVSPTPPYQATPPQPRTPAVRSLRNRPQSEKDKAPTRSKYFEWSEEAECTRNHLAQDEDPRLGKIEDYMCVEVDEDGRDKYEASMGSKARGNKRKPGIALQKAGKQSKKARPAIGQTLEGSPSGDSGIEYRDNMIHPNTMAFLKELGEHNNRSWFSENEMLYRKAKQDFDSFIEKLSQKIIEEVDTTVPELPLKDLVFRIYRDIRFSNDQTPYKIYFSAAWSRTGRKGPYAHYYMQIQPYGKSMIVRGSFRLIGEGQTHLDFLIHTMYRGGIWHADAQPLALLRRAISKRPGLLKQILLTDGIAKGFLDIKGHVDEQRVVESFIARNSEDALKTAPKGFPKDHPEIALLRLRSFTVGRHLTDDEVSNSGFLNKAVDLLSGIEPLITYLNSIVMPDMNMDTSDDTSSEGSNTNP